MGSYTLYQNWPDRPTNPPEREYSLTCYCKECGQYFEMHENEAEEIDTCYTCAAEIAEHNVLYAPPND
jgi:hypothetical protein